LIEVESINGSTEWWKALKICNIARFMANYQSIAFRTIFVIERVAKVSFRPPLQTCLWSLKVPIQSWKDRYPKTIPGCTKLALKTHKKIFVKFWNWRVLKYFYITVVSFGAIRGKKKMTSPIFAHSWRNACRPSLQKFYFRFFYHHLISALCIQ
jgi:hypothetical protein